MNSNSPISPVYLAVGLGAAILLAGTPLFPAVVALLLVAITYDLLHGPTTATA